jgi:arylformamidase
MRRYRTILIPSVIALTLATVTPLLTEGTAGATADAKSTCPASTARVARNVAYVKHPVSPLQRLDVYAPARHGACKPAPVVMWVHGGGWHAGDKRTVNDKVTFFNGLGYVFVSVDYRLSTPLLAGGRPMHPDLANDVGAAVAWVEHHIASYGGDGTRIALLGHSAGAHLVALVGTDPTYLERSGGTFDSLRCVGSYDTESYNLVTRATTRGGILVDNAFGTDPAVLRDASPINHVGDPAQLPAFQIVERGSPERAASEQAFVDAVRGAGGTADVIDAHSLTHGQVNTTIGASNDTVMTPKVKTFVTDCLG